jgi:predicted Rossmann-fold nucleotide-binding protein
LHRKPYGVLNVAGYFDHLLTFLDHAVASRFVRQEHRDLVLVAEHPAELLTRLDHHEPPAVEKWIDRSST